MGPCDPHLQETKPKEKERQRERKGEPVASLAPSIPRKALDMCFLTHTLQPLAMCPLASVVSHCVPLHPVWIRARLDVAVWQKS